MHIVVDPLRGGGCVHTHTAKTTEVGQFGTGHGRAVLEEVLDLARGEGRDFNRACVQGHGQVVCAGHTRRPIDTDAFL